MENLIPSLTVLKKYLPDAWLIPCDNKKRTAGGHLGANERKITPDTLIKALKSKKLNLPCWYDPKLKDKQIEKNVYDQVAGYKILTGKTLTYRCEQVVLVAVDFDGGDSQEQLDRLRGSESFPQTITWASGREGRKTCLFYVPAGKATNLESKVTFGALEVIAGWPGVVLPPAVHPLTGKYEFVEGCSFEQTAIAELPDYILSKIIGSKRVKNLEDIEIPTDRAIPLIECCSREVRSLIAAGVPENSGHNDAALRVAMELTAVERYLLGIGQPFDQDAESLFVDFLAASEVDVSNRSMDRLEWARKKNDTEPSCKPDGVNNCIRGWYWKTVLKRPLPQRQQGKIAFVTPEVKEDIWAELVKLHATNRNLKEIEGKLQDLSETHQVDFKYVDRLSRKAELQIHAEIESEISKENFVEYIKIKSIGLDVSSILPPALAQDLKLNAHPKYHAVRCLSYLWPAIATLTGAKVKVWANKPSNWSSDLVFYCVDIGRKGAGKTPAGSDVLDYILKKDIAARAEFKAQEDHLAAMRREWDRMSSLEREASAGNPEVNPDLYEEQMAPERKWKFDSPTVPAVVKYLGLQPNWHSGILYNDELASLFAGFNQFSKGGNDRQFWLEFFNGRSWKTLERVSDTPGTCRRLSGQLMQVVGGMQLDTFKKYLALSTSQDGLTDRFLISNPPEIAPPTELPRKGTGPSEILAQIYRVIETIQMPFDVDGNIVPNEIDWEPDARDFWEQCYLGLTDLGYKLRKENHDFAGYCSKLITYFPRLAGVLSMIWEASTWDTTMPYTPGNIPLHVAQRTWELVKYYASQYLAIQYAGDTISEPLLAEIWEVVQAEGSINPRNVVRRFGGRKFNGKKLDAKTATRILYELEESGFGQIEQVRTSVQLKYVPPSEELIQQSLFRLKPATRTPGITDLVTIHGVAGIEDGTTGFVGLVNDDNTYVVATEAGDLTVSADKLRIQA